MTEEQIIEDQDVGTIPPEPTRFALVVANFVSRIVSSADGYDAPEITIIASETAQVGDYWDGEEFSAPPEPIRYAVVKDGVVINAILASPGTEIAGHELIASETAGIGQLWDGEEFTDAPPAPVTVEQIDAERDRRIRAGFSFAGRRFQSRDDDRENIAGAATAALAAMINGAQPGDLLWHGGDADFVWIAEDNSLVPMDAQTTFAFGKAAMAQKQGMIFTARALKDLDPRPSDYTDDSYWPD